MNITQWLQALGIDDLIFPDFSQGGEKELINWLNKVSEHTLQISGQLFLYLCLENHTRDLYVCVNTAVGICGIVPRDYTERFTFEYKLVFDMVKQQNKVLLNTQGCEFVMSLEESNEITKF